MEKLALLFDLDGTLIDSAPDIHAGLCAVLRQEELPEVTFAQTQSFIGRGVPALIDQARDALGLKADPDHAARMCVAFNDLYKTAVGQTALYPGAKDALRLLQDQGHALALCTNKPEAPTHAVLDHFGIGGMFKAMSFGDGPYARKPDPAPVHHILAALKAPKAAYIGDSETDAATAKAAGLPFLLFTEGYRKTPVDEIPHHGTFQSFADLPRMIQALSTP